MLEELIDNIGLLLTWLIVGFFVMRYAMAVAGRFGEKQRVDQPSPSDQATPLQEAPSDQWFEVLEVPSSADFDEIKAAYKKKVWQYHPDNVSKLAPEFKEIADRKLKKINAAYEFIARSRGEA
jgi:DnaJ-domain-containing protein 1